MTERERLIELIVDKWLSGVCDMADHLLANGVMLVDTDEVCLVTNREPIRTAFGMPLDELAELIRAKQDGRIIVPPCKVGDTVYCHNVIVWDDECHDCEHYRIGGFGDPRECGRTKDGFKHPDCIKITETVVSQKDILFYLYYNSFGKTVFLTKEEAEKALERSRG